ncbi:MAG: TolC family protein [Chlorobiaceae bacterium]|nr:TolC family protein [Chlorobiaceae bacterium]
MLRPRSARNFIFILLSGAGVGFAQPTLGSVGDGSKGISLLHSVKTGLEHAPAILQEKQVLRSSAAALQTAQSWYDPTISLNSAYRKDARDLSAGGNLHTLSSALSATQRLPSGIALAPAITVDRSATNEFGSIPASRTTAGLTVTVPLFKGLGKDNIYRTTRQAAAQSLEAEKQTLVSVLETSIYGTTSAYWDYLQAWRQRDLARRLTESAEGQLKATRALAEADQIASFMIEQASAYLQQSQALEVIARLAVEESWHGLLLAMGLDPASNPIPEPPIDGFPIPAGRLEMTLPAIDSLQALATMERADLQAVRLSSASAATLLDGYRNQLKPDISLQLWGGYSGSSIGDGFGDYFSSAMQQIPGPNLGATLTWTIDAGNRADHAAYLRQQAQLEQTRIRESELERTARSAVVIALSAVRNAAEVYRLNLKSTEAYRRLRDGELQKFRMGMSNIFNLQTTSNNLASAEQQLLSAEKSFALAVLGLRRATGTLVEERDGLANIAAANLLTVPQPAGGRP